MNYGTNIHDSIQTTIWENFEKKLATVRPEIILKSKTTGRTEKDIIVNVGAVTIDEGQQLNQSASIEEGTEKSE